MTATRTALAAVLDAVAACRSGPPTLDEALGGLAAAGGLALLAWIALVAACTAVAAGCATRGRLGGAVSRAADSIGAGIAPTSLRRLLALALGAALVSGALPAHATTAPRLAVTASETSSPAPGPTLDPAWAAAPAGDVAADRLDPGWSPSPSARAAPRPPTTAGRTASPPGWSPPRRLRAAHEDRAVVVRRGDTLWDIAARGLGPGAGDAEIATAWHRWYATNAAAIGPDPDLLLPGRRLTPPDVTPGGA